MRAHRRLVNRPPSRFTGLRLPMVALVGTAACLAVSLLARLP